MKYVLFFLKKISYTVDVFPGILKVKYPEILPALKQLNSLSAYVPPKTFGQVVWLRSSWKKQHVSEETNYVNNQLT